MAQPAHSPAPRRRRRASAACSTPTAGPGPASRPCSGSSSSSCCSATSPTAPTTSRSSGRSTSGCSPGRRSTSARPRTRRSRARPRPAPRSRGTRRPRRSTCRPAAPTARAGSSATTYLYAGGSDGTAPSADVFFSHARRHRQHRRVVGGPSAARGPRSTPRRVVIGNTIYVIGGFGPDGKPDRHRVQPHPRQRRHARRRVDVEDEALSCLSRAPARRPSRCPTASSSWAAPTAPRRDEHGLEDARRTPPGAWARGSPQSPLFEPNVDGVAVHVGDVVFLIGGSNDDGDRSRRSSRASSVGRGAGRRPQRDRRAVARVGPDEPAGAADEHVRLHRQRRDLRPGRQRRHAPRAETLWATPDADGVIPRLEAPRPDRSRQGIEGSAGVASGSHAFLIGGRTPEGVTNDIARTNLAPAAAVLPARPARRDGPGAQARRRGRAAARLPERGHRGRDQLRPPDPHRLRATTTRRRSARSGRGSAAALSGSRARRRPPAGRPFRFRRGPRTAVSRGACPRPRRTGPRSTGRPIRSQAVIPPAMLPTSSQPFWSR